MFKLLAYNKWSLFIKGIVINTLAALLSLALPYMSGRFIDTVSHQNLSDFITYAFVIAGLTIAIQVVYYFSDLVQGEAESFVWQELTRQTLENLSDYDPKEADLSSKTLMQALGQQYEILTRYFHSFPISFVLYGVRACVILIMLFIISPWMGGVVLLFIPLFILSSQKYADKLSDLNASVVASMKRSRDYLSDVSDLSLSERFLTTKSFTSLSSILNTFIIQKKNYTRLLAIFENFMSYSFLNLMILLATLVSGYQVFVKMISIGEFFAIQLYVSQFWSPMEYFISAYKDYSSDKQLIDEFLVFLSPKKIDYHQTTIDQLSLVNYRGLGKDNQPLHHPITMSFQKGSTYLVKGGNGVGKTHLFHAILGFHNKFLGQIALKDFGENLDFAYCPAKPKASLFYEGEVGSGASMGQLKYHQLNQVLAEDKSVYLFDEPTNFLDDSHKRQLLKALSRLANADTIVIIISHDPIFDGIPAQVVTLKEIG